MNRLLEWDQPALTHEGAIEALKFMAENDVFVDDMGEPLRLAVLGYLESLQRQTADAARVAAPVAPTTVSQSLVDLIDQHRRAVVFLDENPDDDEASESEDRLALEIAAFPTETKADQTAKAEYLLTRSDRWKFCPHEDMYETLLRSMISEVAR
ncbi:hypothetical protein G6M02_00040 [Agrobacterium rhizogenes]|nr:hypothetical protein [Rhizobium rhizogenes]